MWGAEETKITAYAVIFILVEDGAFLGCRFTHRLDALRAHHLLEQAAVLQEGYLLQIRLESSVCGALRK
jgi:hypothetical protein